MNRRSWMAWAVLCAAAVAGGKWILAEEKPSLAEPRKGPSLVGGDVSPVLPPPPARFPDVPKIPSAGGNPKPISEDLPFSEQSLPGAKPVAEDASAVPLDDDAGPPQETIDLSSDPANLRMSPIDNNDPLSNISEQSVTLEWVGPVNIKVGQPFVYELVVRNTGAISASNVVVRDKFPQNMKINSVEPKGIPEADGLMWNIGELSPRQEKRIKLEMVAEKKGELFCQATVSATSPAFAKFRVTEPKLVVRQDCPEKIMMGDAMTITVSVNNPGDGPADGVVIRSILSEGLKNEKGKEFNHELGTLAAGETRSIQVVCTAMMGGQQSIKSIATAENGLLETEAESYIEVTEPKLEVVIDGPKRRYLDRQATYQVAVSNPGNAAANNVKVVVILPPGFKYLSSTGGGRHDFTTRSITWFVGAINGAEKKELAYNVVAVQAGDQQHVAEASGQRGLKATGEIVTGVEGIAALLLDVVDIDDPVEVGADTAYEIRVTNQGSREATNVEIHATVPREMEVRGAQGPVSHRTEAQEIVFLPLPKLAPRAVAIYRIFVKGTGVGDARFQTRLVSDSLTEPVIEEESTKVYDD